MDWERLRQKLLEDLAPDEEELQKLRQEYQKVSEFIEENYGVETHFAGSASRGTCMAGDKDLDIFLMFSPDLSVEELEEKGLKIGKEVFQELGNQYEVEYAEHPYTKGLIDGHEVEIVPCFDTDPESIQSSVDRTPHHSNWVENNLDKEQRKDVILLKAFLRSKKLYGSSLRVRGFSGYLSEIMISEYDSLRNLASEARDWSERKVIDPEDHHPSGLPEKLEDKFEADSLVVIDPVDPERNVASVLTDENYAKFVYSCQKLDRSPGVDMFRETENEVSEFEVKQEMEKRADFLTLELDRPEGVEDVLYPQMRKTVRSIVRELEDAEFRIFDSGFFVGEDKVRILLELDRSLPDTREIVGPKVFHASDHTEEFESRYENVYVNGKRLCSRADREHTDAKTLIETVLSNDPEKIGVPTRVSEAMEGFRFVDSEEGSEQWFNYLAEKFRM